MENTPSTQENYATNLLIKKRPSFKILIMEQFDKLYCYHQGTGNERYPSGRQPNAKCVVVKVTFLLFFRPQFSTKVSKRPYHFLMLLVSCEYEDSQLWGPRPQIYKGMGPLSPSLWKIFTYLHLLHLELTMA